MICGEWVWGCAITLDHRAIGSCNAICLCEPQGASGGEHLASLGLFQGLGGGQVWGVATHTVSPAATERESHH